MKSGHTLLELLLVLSILSLVGSVGVGLSRDSADRLATAQSREEAAAFFHHARAQARFLGGARVEIDAEGRFVLRQGSDHVVDRLETGRNGVRLQIGGGRDSATVVYGPMGIGRAASLTLHFERGRVRSSLVISSYGRIRRAS